jgi:hypothetical protein
MKKKLSCLHNTCKHLPVTNGYCHGHAEEKRLMEERRSAAIDFLHHGTVNGLAMSDRTLHPEARRVREWWDRALQNVNFNLRDPAIQNKESLIFNWCITIAKDLVAQELAYREKPASVTTISHQPRQQAWDQINVLCA